MGGICSHGSDILIIGEKQFPRRNNDGQILIQKNEVNNIIILKVLFSNRK